MTKGNRREKKGVRSYWGMVPVKETYVSCSLEPGEPIERTENFDVIFPVEFEISVRITRTQTKQKPMTPFDIHLSNRHWYKGVVLKDLTKKEEWNIEVWQIK